MFFLIFVAFLRGCILADTDNIITDGFSPDIQWVYVEDAKHFNLSYCDFVVTSNSGKVSENNSDSILLNYVRIGGKLYYESSDFESYSTFSDYIKFIVSEPYTASTLYTFGEGIFGGINQKLSFIPKFFFIIDTQEIWNFIKIEGMPLIDGSIVLYATSLGRGSIIVSALPFMKDSSFDSLRRRIEGYFFPDISIISDSLTEEFKYLKSRLYEKYGIFLRFYTSDFQGLPQGKLVIVDIPQKVIVPDTTITFYMGRFVCSILRACDTVPSYSMFYIRGIPFHLKNFHSLAIKDTKYNKVLFVSPLNTAIGYLSQEEGLGFLPFSLTELDTSEIVRFIKVLKDFKFSIKDVVQKLEYFRGRVNGYLSDVSEIMVFTVDGRLIYKAEGAGKVYYDFNSLPYGFYIIKLKLKSGKDSLLVLNRFEGDKE